MIKNWYPKNLYKSITSIAATIWWKIRQQVDNVKMNHFAVSSFSVESFTCLDVFCYWIPHWYLRGCFFPYCTQITLIIAKHFTKMLPIPGKEWSPSVSFSVVPVSIPTSVIRYGLSNMMFSLWYEDEHHMFFIFRTEQKHYKFHNGISWKV